MNLGLFIFPYGHHLGAWRHPDAPADIAFDLRYLTGVVQAAEQAGLDMVFFSDTVAERENQALTPQATSFEPTSLLASLATQTSHIGLVATMTTSYNAPYNVARRFASLNLLSKGRIGWNVVTTSFLPEALNFNQARHLEHAERYRRAEEFVDVVRGLWGTWDKDALTFDKASGQFFDSQKVRPLHHSGHYFQVRGPLNISNMHHEPPVIVQAGSSGPGKALAARQAEIVFTVQSDFREAQAFYSDLKSQTAAAGRDPLSLRILPGISPFIGSSEAEAEDRYQQLLELIPVDEAVAMLSDQLGGFDFSSYDLSSPLPELPPSNAGQTRRENIIAMAARENLSIRDTAVRHAVTAGHLEAVGTPQQIADRMEEWFTGGACDGFNLKPPVLPHDANRFYAQVLPELQRRGLFRERYSSSSFRTNLGF